MSKIKYIGDVIIFVRHPDKEKPLGTRIEIIKLQVHSFEIVGGATGKIDLASTDEQKVVCQFDQARTHKNVVLYVKQSREVPNAKLIDLPKSINKDFTVSFGVISVKDGTVLRRVSMQAQSNFSETPIPVGGTPPSLRMKLSFTSVELYNFVVGKKTEVMPQTHVDSCS